MTVTNEPGFYKDGEYGIRIENVMLVQVANTRERFGDIDYLEFEAVTVVPIQTKLVKKELLTNEEVEWLNNYHKRCWDVISPLLQGDLEEDRLAREWLQRETRPI
jgi:Xaa-Pro aminopeptidase